MISLGESWIWNLRAFELLGIRSAGMLMLTIDLVYPYMGWRETRFWKTYAHLESQNSARVT